jgi:hypothetical protein
MPFHPDRAYGAVFFKGFTITNFVVLSSVFGVPAQRVNAREMPAPPAALFHSRYNILWCFGIDYRL